MKRFFKNTLLLFALVGLFSACSKDDDNTPEIEYGEATLVSIGFYAEDNPNVIFKDYVATTIGSSITINLPSEVDKSSLIARFETSVDDKVLVGGVAQESGVTANNYIAPVDFIVNEGTNNTKYTLTVGKMPAAVWTSLPDFSSHEVKEMVLRVNPENQKPYLAYVMDADEYADQKAAVVALTDGAWSNIGADGFTVDRARYLDFNFDATGKPYVAFADYNILDADGKQFYASSMMAFEGNSWNYVGEKGITDVKINLVSVGFDVNNTPFTFNINYSAGSTAGRREINTMKYDGSWISSPITGRSGYSRDIAVKTVNGILYVAALNYGDMQSVSVYKYDGTSWTTIAEKMKESADNVVYYYNVSLDVDAKGNVYVAYAEDNSGDRNYKLRVKKYSKESETWSTLGDVIESQNCRKFDVAVSPLGVPVLAFTDDQKYPIAVAFDAEVNNWGTPVALEAAECGDVKMVMSSEGVGYACFTVNEVVKVMKYDTPVQE